MTIFSRESEFEEAVIHRLRQLGWGDSEVLRRPTEADLLENWKQILFENNRGVDRLNNVPLTDTEMQQIMEQIAALRTPLKLNGFINGKSVTITRDNPDDELHFGRQVGLKIYDRLEIAAGQSRYQIAQQPQYARVTPIHQDRRGDLQLLINGMPVIHIELKRSGVPVSNAYNQIEKYSKEGIFSGIFSLIQVFVAMAPEEALYFANPGPDGVFNKDYAFHWADFNNEPIKEWNRFTSTLLSIPMAHQLIGFYTVADEADGVLKVMRSYQYYAARAVSTKVAKTDWQNPNRLGGYVWHTTGSGKTMTSFKCAQLVANSRDADKVVFLLDRVELGNQTLKAYRNFAGDAGSVQATENTATLVEKLKSDDYANTLIVTSIQKMSRIKDVDGGLNAYDLEVMRSKRIVFIVDECHRSTFGEMLTQIKRTFPGAIFFGFTGTPIHTENIQNGNTTTDVFGDELHRYSIADGIRDKNVLGFDPYQVLTYQDRHLRQAVALEKARADSVQEALADPEKRRKFNHYMNNVPMAGYVDEAGVRHKGIEDYVPKSQYTRPEHQRAVVQDIIDNWDVLSQGSKFHAIFATSSIFEAIAYYRLFKEMQPSLKVTALFDPNPNEEDDGVDQAFKTAGLVEILQDYNDRYGQRFDIGRHHKFKEDLSYRLAHKEMYKRIENDPDKQLDLLIVVNQMLTGFDSKWVNTLYLDKLLDYENIIQAFSRTNRLFGPDKPFGTIRYYRMPHTMARNVEAAVRLYSGDKPTGLFVNRLPRNLERLNAIFAEIQTIFMEAGIQHFNRLPDQLPARAEFAKRFNEFNAVLAAAKIQGFTWDKLEHEFSEPQQVTITLSFNETQYVTLLQRYRELASGGEGGGGGDVPFDINTYIVERSTGQISADYMNAHFQKFLRDLNRGDEQAINATLEMLHRSFASLSQEDQRIADIFLNDVQRGETTITADRTFQDYLNDYKIAARNKKIENIVSIIGVDRDKLVALIDSSPNENNLNEFGRFDDLKVTIDRAKAKEYFEEREGRAFTEGIANIKAVSMLRQFILDMSADG